MSMATRFSKPDPNELADSVFQLKECMRMFKTLQYPQYTELLAKQEK